MAERPDERLARENRIWKRAVNDVLEELNRSRDEAERLRRQNRALEEALGRERAERAERKRT